MPTKNLKRGLFITFEGVEGCGKSTHSKLIYKYLKREGYPCLYTKEPGGTKIGDKIREILLNPKNTRMSEITELFLFEANRSQVVSEVIRPALARKMVVISDRFFDATLAYQGYASSIDKDVIKKMNNLSSGGVRPNLTLILDIDVRKGLRRAGRRKRLDRMEKKSSSYHNCVRRGYLAIAKEQPHRVKLIPTQKRVEDTQELIRREVLDVLGRYKVAR